MNNNKKIVIALVGNPNCGKTTVFNALTGARQHVGNWPGVTVERKSGFFSMGATNVEVVDLPGIYSLISSSETSSIDERIAAEFIVAKQADLIVNVLDASNLERNLYLTTQLLEMQVPLVLAVNMIDVAANRKIKLALDQLAIEWGCPVIGLTANKGKGIQVLKQTLVHETNKPSSQKLNYPAVIEQAIANIQKKLLASSRGLSAGSRRPELLSLDPADKPRDDAWAENLVIKSQDDAWSVSRSLDDTWMAIRLLEDDVFAKSQCSPEILAEVNREKAHIHATLSEDADILLADARYKFIEQKIKNCLFKNKIPEITWTSRFDQVILNRWLGIPIFLIVMYAMFLFAINIGGAFQDFFDIGSDTIFVDGLAHALTALGAPSWLTAILANGVGKGINTTITFIPVIGAMFLGLAFLEDSGYMARAAFVVDRFMRALGLPGKSFVPMVVGFGCNVPGVMAARTLENKRDRILTVMMSPFMSCGARLAIYAVFTSAFFAHGGQNVVFALYLIGILMAMLTGLLLRKTVLKGDPAPLVMELPPYHIPHIKTLSLHAWHRLKTFIFRAGKLIVPICVIIGALNALNIDGSINSGEGDAHSLLSLIGQWLTPIFAPMGIHQDNWPATVGLVTGTLAKEVVVGTLNTLYSQIGHLASAPDETFNLAKGLYNAVLSIPTNFSQLGSSLANPVLAKAPVHTVAQGVYGVMYQRFDGQIGAIAYLLFVLLYFPCVSTTAAMLREVHRVWTWFSVLWTTGIAYAVAVFFYQAATILRHPFSSILWMGGIVGVFVMIIFWMRYLTPENSGGSYEFARN